MINENSQLAIILTDQCNLECKYCLRDAGCKKNNEIPFDDLKKIILLAHNNGYRDVGLTGGEALLYPHFDQLIDMLCELKWKIFLESNSILLNDKQLEMLKTKIGYNLTILTSLDSHIEKINDLLRGKNSFTNTIVGIKRIVSYGIKLQVNMVVTPINMLTSTILLEYIQFLEKLHVTQISLSRVVSIGRGKDKYQLSDEQCNQMRTILNEINHKSIIGHSFQHLNEMHSCSRLYSQGNCISSKGIHPCIYLTNIILDKLDNYEGLLDSKFLETLNNLRFASLCTENKNIYSCPECVNNFSEYLKKIQNLNVNWTVSEPKIKVNNPNHMSILVTNKCDHNCYFCHFDCKEDGKELSFEIMNKLLVEGKELGITSVNFNGGEPLTYSFINESLKLANNLNYNITMITNGWNYFEKKNTLIINNVQRIMFGLDGMNATTHNNIRGKPGSFEKVINAILDAKKSGFIVGINYVVTPDNYMELNQLLDFVDKNEIYELQIFNAVKDGRAKNNPKIYLNHNHLDHIKQVLKKHTKVLGNMKFLNCTFLSEKGSSTFCNYLKREALSIDWKGEVTICPLSNIYGINFPSLTTQNFRECIEDINVLISEHKDYWKSKRKNWYPKDKHEYCEFCFPRFEQMGCNSLANNSKNN